MPCPICKRPPDPKYRPFCSKRCADVDLAKWLNGAYAVPVEETEEWEEDTLPPRDESS
ncbi:zinc-binding protein [Rhodobacteraceae bacterium THAF1]|uniref:DNA gyrase inhibitor YacG n=1 Tax=Palleronia sp. THAF1 TaxID=2587842 RepID=UPI000F41C770|nr:DNA gyrase inhibitor YacG [Palleronia sp. THAF1]QFU07703.1 zinc-binding protein [Palleronia sp. THAF1]VDC23159.1 zinc-binding protein [Rhodobacteraceae bacterium THAF1]